MTRAEVNKNIRYNEQLVNSYQDSIQTLNTQINELMALKRRIQSCQNDFGNREQNRKNKLVNGFSGKFNLRSVETYTSGMKNLISGTEYRNAYNGLSAAMQKIDNQINSLRNEISTCNSKLIYRKNRITYWKRQLKYAR